MRVVEEVRRLRLLELKAEYGSYAALTRLLNLPSRDSTLNQIATQQLNSKTGKQRHMGSDQARRLEKCAGKPLGWMDTDPDASDAWPFPLVDRTQWERLPTDAKLHIQRGLKSLLAQYDDDAAADPPSAAITTGNDHMLGTLHEPIRKPYRAGGR